MQLFLLYLTSWQRVIVAPFLTFLVPYNVESCVSIFFLNWGQGVSSIEEKASKLDTIEVIFHNNQCVGPASGVIEYNGIN